jgi:hypothetical protein
MERAATSLHLKRCRRVRGTILGHVLNLFLKRVTEARENVNQQIDLHLGINFFPAQFS